MPNKLDMLLQVRCPSIAAGIGMIATGLKRAATLVLWALAWVLFRILAMVLVLCLCASVVPGIPTSGALLVVLAATLTDLLRFLLRNARWPPLLLGIPILAFGLATVAAAVVNGTALLSMPVPSPGAPILNPRSAMLARAEAAGAVHIVWSMVVSIWAVAIGALLCTASVRKPMGWLKLRRAQAELPPLMFKQAAAAVGMFLFIFVLYTIALFATVSIERPPVNTAGLLASGSARLGLALHFLLPAFGVLAFTMFSAIVLNTMAMRNCASVNMQGIPPKGRIDTEA